jgi:hypothetical protein
MTNGHFEAKKHGYRQTQDGVVISFVVHPNDVSPEIATAALGTRYMVGFAEIGDDDQPARIVQEQKNAGETGDAGSTPAARSKERRPFDSLPLSQQAAIRCQDRDFRTFLAQKDGPSEFLMLDLDMAADEVRNFCGIKSRSQLDDNLNARQKWRELEDHYQAYLTDRMYPAEARR